MNTVTFKNGEYNLSDVLGVMVTLKKNDFVISGRFLRGEGDNIFKCDKLKTKKNALKQFEVTIGKTI